MSIKPVDITDTYVEFLSLSDAKDQCRVTSSDYDTLLTSLIASVIKSFENYTWRVVRETQFEYRLDEFPEDILELPKPPHISVDSVQYVNNSGTQTYAASNYRVDLNGGRLEPVTSWPSTKDQIDAVIITFTSGYDKSETDDHRILPPDAVTGMKMLLKYLFDNREAVAVSDGRTLDVEELPFGVKFLWTPYSLRDFG